MLAKKLWDTLSVIDVSDHTEKKGQFTYLSWSWAHSIMMSNFPNSSHTFEETTYPDGTMMVTCYVTVTEGDESLTRHMFLPVLDFRNKPISNPSSMHINTARQRCYVKALSMLGLGLYIYSGEDLPAVMSETIDKDVIDEINRLIEETGSNVDKFCKAFNVNHVNELTKAQAKKAIGLLGRKK